jgi:hypothetical protein
MATALRSFGRALRVCPLAESGCAAAPPKLYHLAVKPTTGTHVDSVILIHLSRQYHPLVASLSLGGLYFEEIVEARRSICFEPRALDSPGSA